MKRYLILIALLFISVVGLAQDTSKGVTVGMAFNQNATPQISGWGTYDHQISGRLFSYSGYDVAPLIQANSKIPKLKFLAFSGFAVHTATLGKLSLWLMGAGGMATTGDTVTGSGNFGGFGHYALGNGWGLILGAQGNYSPISGTDATIRAGFRYGVK